MVENSKKIYLYSEIKNISAKKVSDLNAAEVIVTKEGNIEIGPKVGISTGLDKDISELLIKLGMKTNFIGYHYTKEVIMTIINNPNKFVYAREDIYSEICKKYDKTTFCVENQILYAIDSIFENTNKKLQISDLKFMLDIQKIKKTEFVFCIAEHFRLKEKQSRILHVYYESENLPFSKVYNSKKANLIVTKGGSIKTNSDLTSLNRFEIEISELLIRFGISPNLRGYYYAKEAIKRIINDPDEYTSGNKLIYHEIAETFSTEPSCVRTGIKYINTLAFATKNIELRQEILDLKIDFSKMRSKDLKIIFIIAKYFILKNTNFKYKRIN